MSPYVDPRRLAIGALVVALLALPVYYFLLSEPNDPLVAPPALLDTPSSGPLTAVGLEPGKLAPNFEVSTPDGRRQTLAQLRGRTVLINFWSTWCGSCLTEMPEIKSLQAEKPAGAFEVLAINAGETREQAQAFIDFLDAPFNYGYDLDLTVSDAYGVYGLPLSIFIDAGGVVRAVYRGHADRQRLDTLLQAAIASRPAADLAPVIRSISTIPRERVLNVARSAANELTFTSRSLRCDPSYCISDIASRLNDSAITSAVLDADRALRVRFGGGAPEEARVVTAVSNALTAIPDPLYDRPLQVRYE